MEDYYTREVRDLGPNKKGDREIKGIALGGRDAAKLPVFSHPHKCQERMTMGGGMNTGMTV